MSEEPNKPEENVTAQGLPVTIHAQYLKDLSFESPLSPQSIQSGKGAPDININFAMDAQKIESEEDKNLYEVVLRVNVIASRDETPMFIVELDYGAVVSIAEEVPEDRHHPILLIEIPRQMFPFVRQILADITIQGGFPPLLLAPADFHAMYVDRFKDDIEQAQAEIEAAAEQAETETVN